jgi:hypothetical protein
VIDVYGALGFVTTSTGLFYPQDGDGLSRTTRFSMKLKSPATVTWTVVDAAGAVVRTFRAEEQMEPGTYTYSWNGRDDAGAYVPQGTYRSSVTATNGVQGVTQQSSTIASAFKISVSDSTPRRGQKITITIVSAEPLERAPRIGIYQSGIAGWSVSTKAVASRTYRATVTLRSSSTGTVRIKANGSDSYGRVQYTNRTLPLD